MPPYPLVQVSSCAEPSNSKMRKVPVHATFFFRRLKAQFPSGASIIMSRRVLAIALAYLLTGVSLLGQSTWPAQTTPLGVVTQSALAHLNTTDAPVGTSVYDNDRLETGDRGTLSLRGGNVELLLMENSGLLMNHDGSGLTPALQRGSVVFRAENGTGIQVVADDVHVRSHTSVLTIGQVTLENCYVLVTARTQSLEVTAGKETKILDEGKSYRVLRPGPCAAAQNRSPALPAAHGRFLLVPAVVGAITLIGVREALESPDRP